MQVKALIEWRGISVDMKDYDGRAPIHVAASEGRLDVVQYLGKPTTHNKLIILVD